LLISGNYYTDGDGLTSRLTRWDEKAGLRGMR
jgi:hypothetical protein